MPVATRPAPRFADNTKPCAGCLALERRVEALEARHRRANALRDAADGDLLLAIVGAVEGLPFTARALWTRGLSVNPLAAALERADLSDTRELGAWLRRIQDADVLGWTLVQDEHKHRDGVLWRLVRLADSHGGTP